MSKTVLVIDDEAGLLRAYTRCLEKAGYKVLTALDTSSARALLEKEKIDLCISDLALPGENGLDFIKKLRTEEKFKNLPVIIQTGFGHMSSKEVMAVYPHSVLNKPISPEDLLWAVGDALGQKPRK